MRYLVATDSVHTTAAACDYLHERLDSADRVLVATVPQADGRDAGDALNVAQARLAGSAEFETTALDTAGAPASAILAAATRLDADEILVGPHAGVPGAGPALGETARRVIEGADVPVVVVPLSL